MRADKGIAIHSPSATSPAAPPSTRPRLEGSTSSGSPFVSAPFIHFKFKRRRSGSGKSLADNLDHLKIVLPKDVMYQATQPLVHGISVKPSVPVLLEIDVRQSDWQRKHLEFDHFRE